MNIINMYVNIEWKLFFVFDSLIWNFKNLSDTTWIGEFIFSNVNFMKSKYRLYILNKNVWSKLRWSVSVKIHS